MFQNLRIEHLQLAEAGQKALERRPGALHWKTCVRELQIHWQPAQESASEADLEVYYGSQAAAFLAEVVSGLHSPLTGETEVHGQYKDLLRNHMDRLPAELREALFGVHWLAKQTRHLHLRGLGSQSYGSLARRKLRSLDRVFVFGAGHLAEEILPWLSKAEKFTQVYARDPKKAQNLRELFPKVSVLEDLLELDKALEAIVVAAPISASSMQQLISENALKPKKILDFRGESRHDPIEGDFEVISLDRMFAEIQNCKTSAVEKVEAAHEFIRQNINQSLEQMERVAKTARCL